jgi:hypothetical protein
MTKTKTKPKAPAKSVQTKATPVKSVQEAKPAEGYAGHKVGSRKATIHELFDKEGDDVAWTRGKKTGLKETTLRTWFAFWRRSAKPATAKKATKVKNNSVNPPVSKSEAVPAAA